MQIYYGILCQAVSFKLPKPTFCFEIINIEDADKYTLFSKVNES